MQTRERSHKTLTNTEAQEQFQELLGELQGGGARTLIEVDGTPVAAMISAADLERFERDEAYNALVRFSLAFKDEPIDEVEREVAKAVREVKEERLRAGYYDPPKS